MTSSYPVPTLDSGALSTLSNSGASGSNNPRWMDPNLNYQGDPDELYKNQVKDVFNEVLIRDPRFDANDPHDADYWVDQLKSGAIDLAGFRSAVQGSTEATDLINLFNTNKADSIAHYGQEEYDRRIGNNASATAGEWARARMGLAEGGVEHGQMKNQGWGKYAGVDLTGGNNGGGSGLTQDDRDWIESLNTGGGYSGPTMADFQSMLQDTFGNPWTPWGYGWGGNNSDAVRINRSQASRRGSSYAGNKSSFNRDGSRLNTQGTPWMSTLNI
tara:strand:- start:103 stop:918 length:816 start_codon:yes stop_codon:yes gene_type:complete